MAFSALFNKAWIEWARSLSLAWETLDHKQADERVGAATAALPHVHTTAPSVLKCPYLQLRDSLYSLRSCTHTHDHTEAFLAAAEARARLLRLKIRGGIINHKKAPSGQIKFVLIRAERNASRAKTGPRWLGGVRGMPGFSLHPQAYQSHGLGRGRGFRKAKWDAAPTGDRFVCSPFRPAAKEKQLEGWRAHCSNPASVLDKLHL